MKITFIFPRDKEYNSETVRQQPCGGTEKCVIFLGEAFQKLGHEVDWITSIERTEEAINGSYKTDLVITQEAQFLEFFPKARKVWWTHHFTDQPVIQRSAAYARAFADKVVTLSQCQHDDYRSNFRIDSVIIGHGVWHDEICTNVEKDPFRLIYASTPFRGLAKIPSLFKAIKTSEPRATIAICSSMGTYGEAHKDAEYQKLFDELAEIPGVELKGALNQAQLYAEYSRASIFFYPCTWPETYCLAMDEAIAHECVISVPDIGALHERLDRPIGGLHSRCVDDARIGNIPPNWLDIARRWEAEVLA